MAYDLGELVFRLKAETGQATRGLEEVRQKIDGYTQTTTTATKATTTFSLAASNQTAPGLRKIAVSSKNAKAGLAVLGREVGMLGSRVLGTSPILRSFVNLFRAIGPMGWAVIGVGLGVKLLVSYFDKIKQKTQEVIDAVDRMNESLSGLGVGLSTPTDKLNAWLTRAQEGTGSRKAQLETLIADLTQRIQDTAAAGAPTDRLQQQLDTLVARYNALTAAIRRAEDELQKLGDEAMNDRRDGVEGVATATDKFRERMDSAMDLMRRRMDYVIERADHLSKIMPAPGSIMAAIGAQERFQTPNPRVQAAAIEIAAKAAAIRGRLEQRAATDRPLPFPELVEDIERLAAMGRSLALATADVAREQELAAASAAQLGVIMMSTLGSAFGMLMRGADNAAEAVGRMVVSLIQMVIQMQAVQLGAAAGPLGFITGLFGSLFGQPATVRQPVYSLNVNMNKPSSPLAVARDREWQRALRESLLVAESQGFRM